MNRILTLTAMGLMLGLTPALAESQDPANDAVNQPSSEQPMAAPERSSDAPAATGIVAPQTEAAPQSISPEHSITAPQKSTELLLNQQKSGEVLASNLIGKSVVNAKNESVGEINDLVSDQGGKIVAVLVGTGGFLGIGQKDVAIRYEDLRIARDADNQLTVMVDIDKETLAAAPDYKRLDSLGIVQGSNKSDREDNGATRTY